MFICLFVRFISHKWCNKSWLKNKNKRVYVFSQNVDTIQTLSESIFRHNSQFTKKLGWKERSTVSSQKRCKSNYEHIKQQTHMSTNHIKHKRNHSIFFNHCNT